MAQALIGRPGWPPGKSQGESVRPRTVWLRRTATCRRASSATGAGSSTGIDQATLAPLVHRLELWGLLAREVAPANRRRKLLTLTDDGIATLDRIRPLGEAVEEAVLGGLPDAKRAVLLEALRWISDTGRRSG
jgi:DNA-binding MarR family transcriptional regulator